MDGSPRALALRRITADNPMVTLNHAIATAMVLAAGPARCPSPRRPRSHHRLDAGV
jgi:hypothetical protein